MQHGWWLFWVNVDFAHVAAQLGVDLFYGQGWEAYDRGEKTAPRPDQKGEQDGSTIPT